MGFSISIVFVLSAITITKEGVSAVDGYFAG
jgi:hypothetical protein